MSPKIEKGFHLACEDLRPDRKLIVYPGADGFPLSHGVEVAGLPALLRELATV